MCHTCMLCGELCYCDGEDHESDQSADCIHICEDDEAEDLDWDQEEIGGVVAHNPSAQR